MTKAAAYTCIHDVQMNSEQFNKTVCVYNATNVNIDKYLDILPGEAIHSEHSSFGGFAIREAPWLNSEQLPTTVFAAAEITLNDKSSWLWLIISLVSERDQIWKCINIWLKCKT